MAKTRGMLASIEAAAQGEGSAKRAAIIRAETPAEDGAPKRGKAAGGANNPSRAGRVNVTGYFDPAVKQSIRMIQAKYPRRLTEQDLLAEALNDLFAKYAVPQTAKQ